MNRKDLAIIFPQDNQLPIYHRGETVSTYTENA